MPWLSRLVRSRLLSGDLVLLAALIAGAGTAAGRLSWGALRGPNAWLIAVLAWSAGSAWAAPYPVFAIAEMLRLALGGGVYFAAAFVLRPAEVRLLPLFLICLGAAVGLYELTQFGQSLDSSGVDTNSIFGNHEQLGSFLTLLLAPALALALDRERRTRLLLVAQGAAVIVGAALLLARTRSAWAGAAVSLLLLSALSLRFSSVRLTRSSRALLIGPALLVVLGFSGLLLFGQLAPLVSKRAATLSHAMDDVSLSDRLHRWRSACRMASEKPVTGWGLGAWPVIEGRWTHQGDDVSEVLGAGTGHSNIAHNFWVQWTAETGGVGLALYLAFLASFFVTAFSALPRLDRDSRTLLIASLVGVAAGIADMVGAPSYTFPGVSSLFFVWLGLGMGVIGEAPQNTAKVSRRAVWTARLVPVTVGLCGALVVIGIGNTLRAGGATAPRGILTVTASPPGPVSPGTRVVWTATYQAPGGSLRPTAPGTVWTTDTGSLEKTSPTYISVNHDPQRSGWQGNVAPGSSQVTVTAHYWDRFSREYTASKMVTVK
jgi:O-antigen ligase